MYSYMVDVVGEDGLSSGTDSSTDIPSRQEVGRGYRRISPRGQGALRARKGESWIPERDRRGTALLVHEVMEAMIERAQEGPRATKPSEKVAEAVNE